MSDPGAATCIAAAQACAEACDECAAACLHQADVTPMAACIALVLDCAQLGRLSASMLARGSSTASTLGGICADLCEQTASECARHALVQCQRCADQCRRSAREWRELVARQHPPALGWARHEGAATH